MEILRNKRFFFDDVPYEPQEDQVERAAKTWMEWQFAGKRWNMAPETMKNKFREGARAVLIAAGRAY